MESIFLRKLRLSSRLGKRSTESYSCWSSVKVNFGQQFKADGSSAHFALQPPQATFEDFVVVKRQIAHLVNAVPFGGLGK